jgi:RNA polymerase sigma-70 factor (ECF subfamily)
MPAADDATADEDATAVDRTLGGDTEAFGSVVARWQDRLVTLAFRFCRDRALAEDLAQTALLKAFRTLAQWRRRGPFGAWLLAIATNSYRSALRRRPPASSALDPAALASPLPSIEPGERELVRAAVAKLPPRYRDVLVLFYFTGCDVRATAAALGVAEGTVKARLSRGRDRLRRMFAARPERPGSTSPLPQP